ncbi:hypothetical protein [Altererythrobacter sp. MF3-039]|uniref:hypothetical protein n=1 Tax=Altererythrobacter sp. MF3-039 TaxID=3252901 RepID=UPI00390C4708
MSSASRREVIRKGGLSAIGAIWALNAQSVLAKAGTVVNVPSGPMRLRREITRELIDGNRLTVARVWNVRFLSAANGWRVEGTQRDVEVKAPAGLESLAALERSRQTEESFPLELDSHGMIMAGPVVSRQIALDQLGQAAHSAIDSLGGAAVRHNELRAFLAQLQQASLSMMTRWPQDLFFPAGSESSEKKAMDLPGGVSGRMEIIYRAEADLTNGLLKSSERTVVTRIENEELRSSEVWKLTAA